MITNENTNPLQVGQSELTDGLDQPTHEGWWTRKSIPDRIPLKVEKMSDGKLWVHGFSGLFECSKFTDWIECKQP
ncbi:hypothetical protein [Methylobacter sp.]|uniref:hypothetical protein n=1 Tax=Methylobacter sp. TaxID=2051955 RepID=UPI002FE21A12